MLFGFDYDFNWYLSSLMELVMLTQNVSLYYNNSI